MLVRSKSVFLKLHFAVALGLLSAVAVTVPAHAQACDLRLAGEPAPVRLDYDPFAISHPPGRLDFELLNAGDASCQVDLRLLNADGQALRTLYLEGTRLDFRPRDGGPTDTTSVESDRFPLSVPAGGSALVQFDVVVTGDVVPDAGEHHAALRIEIGPLGGEPLVRLGPIEVVLASPPRAQLNIAGAAGAFGSTSSVEVIDFGEARGGAVKRAFLQVRANTEARLTFSSENGGSLRRLDADDDEPGIDYLVTLDGGPIDLRREAKRDIDPPRTMAGQSLHLDFELGPTSARRSGRYEDLLMVSIDPN